ncbi:MAG: hypothetical protein KFW07_02905 [Mycoplasmataceae bacterium]|nr:hypothetical protein [Mycoplasmataceae bacterium]
MQIKIQSKKIKINYIDNKYWLVPSIFTLSRKGWVSIPFRSLEELILKNNLDFEEAILSFNGDPDFNHFNNLMKIRDINFSLSPRIMKDKDFIELELKDLIIIFDEKSVIAIRGGNIPYYSSSYLQKLSSKYPDELLANKKPIFYWRNQGLVKK